MRWLNKELRNVCDILVRPNEEADEKIVDEIIMLRDELTTEQKLRLNTLLDNINKVDSTMLYEAFDKGFMLGCIVTRN